MDPSARAVRTDSRLTAILGPTNTGKTHFAIEQMISYPRGMIGFPLRLLARENYERLVALKGHGAVALVTGEEKIIPEGARYFSCTVEAMPVEREVDFLAVDEIHLCADPERGHIFTDRLLRARGTQATMWMGAATIRPLLAALVPKVEFIERPRLSQLSYTGFKKMTRLPKRSAVVAFSVDEVYAIAEMIRRTRGGTAVVLGALSPRTRNKQVELYQNGEVDFLVATDAIGMGLNMDIHHIALAATKKFDGQVLRNLTTAEIAQVAGRAGRYLRDGTFGTTARVSGLEEEVVEAVENHEFETLTALCWRNAVLDFSAPRALLASLEKFSGTGILLKGRPADDLQALEALSQRDDVMARAQGRMAVERLWEVCQIPDFRKTLSERHQELLGTLYVTLMDRGVLPEDMVASQIEQLDRLEGEVDALMARIAHIRTWTYITHKSEWLQDAAHWAARARAVEDRLSDALHEGLTRRFVDRKAAALLRAMETGQELLAGVRANGEVVVEGQEVGTIVGFRFLPLEDAVDDQNKKAVMAAARRALKPEVNRRLIQMLNAVPKQFKLDAEGRILFQSDASNPLPGEPVATVRKGGAILSPEVEVIDTNLLEGQDKALIAEKLREWVKQHISTVLEALTPLLDEEGLSGPARGIAYQLHENLGIVARDSIQELIGGLDEAGRASLRQRKVRLGPVLVFLPALTKPAGVRLRALLWSLWHGRELPASVPPDGATTAKVEAGTVDPVYYRAIGYPVYGPRAIRVDMLDRLITAIYDGAKDGTFRAQPKMAEWLGCPVPVLYEVLEAMGHQKVEEAATVAPKTAQPDSVQPGPAESDSAAPDPTAPDSAESTTPVDVETAQSVDVQENGDAQDAPTDDAVEIAELSSTEAPSTETPETETPETETPETETPETEAAATEVATDVPSLPPPVARPQLALFRLRRGRGAPAGQRERGPRQRRKKPNAVASQTPRVVKPDYLTEEEKTALAEKAKEREEARARRAGQNSEGPGNNNNNNNGNNNRRDTGSRGKDDKRDGRRDDFRGGGGRDNDRGRGRDKDRDGGVDRIVSSAKPAATEASPFAALQSLKVKSRDGG